VGAKPLYLSCSLIIEEGLDKSILEKVILSMKKTAQKARVKIVTGDTKVVGKGSADKIYQYLRNWHHCRRNRFRKRKDKNWR
jgi:hydrogenase expression/formation protein HypE